MSDTQTLIPIRFVARQLRIPLRWLRTEALCGRIPCLDAGGTILADPVAVMSALAERAAGAARAEKMEVASH